MANCIGYETLYLNGVAQAPDTSIVGGGVACAIFFVDPRSKAKAVRYVPGQVKSEKITSTFRPPTPTRGIPLKRGKSIVVAGEGSIRNSWFVAEGDSALLHCIYYDRVDVVDMGLDVDQDLLEINMAIKDRLEQILIVLKEREK